MSQISYHDCVINVNDLVIPAQGLFERASQRAMCSNRLDSSDEKSGL